MPSCVIKSCKNYFEKHKKISGITFHVFPRDKLKKRKRIEIVRKEREEEMWAPTRYSVICSNHFRKDDFYLTKKGFIRLNRKAWPLLQVSGAGMSLIFVEELKLLIERQVLGICPQSFKIQGNKVKSNVTTTCDLDMDPQQLAGRFAALALRAHSAARSNECSRLGISLANVFGELARTASNTDKQATANSIADSKKRKLSKSQKAKIQAKQRTALAVKKKAAAIAARVSS